MLNKVSILAVELLSFFGPVDFGYHSVHELRSQKRTGHDPSLPRNFPAHSDDYQQMSVEQDGFPPLFRRRDRHVPNLHRHGLTFMDELRPDLISVKTLAGNIVLPQKSRIIEDFDDATDVGRFLFHRRDQLFVGRFRFRRTFQFGLRMLVNEIIYKVQN